MRMIGMLLPAPESPPMLERVMRKNIIIVPASSIEKYCASNGCLSKIDLTFGFAAAAVTRSF